VNLPWTFIEWESCGQEDNIINNLSWTFIRLNCKGNIVSSSSISQINVYVVYILLCWGLVCYTILWKHKIFLSYLLVVDIYHNVFRITYRLVIYIYNNVCQKMPSTYEYIYKSLNVM
jgi:hypothetical protein